MKSDSDEVMSMMARRSEWIIIEWRRAGLKSIQFDDGGSESFGAEAFRRLVV